MRPWRKEDDEHALAGTWDDRGILDGVAWASGKFETTFWSAFEEKNPVAVETFPVSFTISIHRKSRGTAMCIQIGASFYYSKGQIGVVICHWEDN